MLLAITFVLATLSPAQHIEQLAARYYKPDEPGAVILAVRDDQGLVRKGYGLADMELGTPLRPEMLLKVGSITKQFVAVAVLQLANDGKLALGDPVTKFLPDFPHAVTIEQLLTHTAGLVDYVAVPEYRPQLRQDATPAEIIALLHRPLEFPAGTRFKYTNSAYFLLGAVVEKASGQRLGEYLRTRVFAPTGLTNTRVDSLTEIIPNRARGYQRDATGALRHAELYSPTRAFAVGDLLSTVDDLRRWNAAVGKLVATDRAWTSHRVNDKPTGYGYGWFVSELEGARVIEHGGDIPGFSAHVLSIPDRRIFVAVLSNDAHHDPRPDFVATQIATILLGKPYDPVAVPMSAEELERFIGTYRNAAGVERRVTRDGTHLFVERVGGRKSEVFPLGNGAFFYPRSFMTVQFEDETLILRQKGTELDRAARVP